METKDKLDIIKKIYEQQHYFIDRHDSMAEKHISALLAEVAILTIITSVFGKTEKQTVFFGILFVAFAILFFITLVNSFLIISPLSSKAQNLKNLSFVDTELKQRISTSSLYYKGILKQVLDAKVNNCIPIEKYKDNITFDNLLDDYTNQIFILAHYNQYKHNKLKINLGLLLVTTVLAILCICLTLF